MREIRVFTEEYNDVLAQKLPESATCSLEGLVTGLAEAAVQIMGKGDQHVIETKFRDFLEENEYIHLDAFIRICLEDGVSA